MKITKIFLITAVLAVMSCSEVPKSTYDDLRSRSAGIEDHILLEVATYIDNYRAASELYKSLANKDWVVVYRPNVAETLSRYDKTLSIHSIIYFDPSVGAVMETGIASPADVLLHEMLHVREVTEKEMALRVYPTEHELYVISLERELYHSMNTEDGLTRPQRHAHTGILYRAACATCPYPQTPLELVK